jgi:hypothetical protein
MVSEAVLSIYLTGENFHFDQVSAYAFTHLMIISDTWFPCSESAQLISLTHLWSSGGLTATVMTKG